MLMCVDVALSWLQDATIFHSRDDGRIKLCSSDCMCRASEVCHAGMEYGVCRMLYITGPQIQQGSKVQSKYSSSWDCARQLYRHGGVANLYQGTMATMLRGTTLYI